MGEMEVKQIYSNATVYFTEAEIVARECLLQNIYQILKDTWFGMNDVVKFYRVETPVLTPGSELRGHLEAEFQMLSCQRGYLRPEIAGGCFAAFFDMFPQVEQRQKKLPICIWQAGKSFREEINPDTMRASKLRLCEFWQLEFELICSESTQADYMGKGIEAILNHFRKGEIVYSEELPHYSIKTRDWMIDGLEVAGCSIRKDLPGYQVHEISIGLDRLLAVL